MKEIKKEGIFYTQKNYPLQHLQRKKINSPSYRKLLSPKKFKPQIDFKQHPISPQTQSFNAHYTVRQKVNQNFQLKPQQPKLTYQKHKILEQKKDHAIESHEIKYFKNSSKDQPVKFKLKKLQKNQSEKRLEQQKNNINQNHLFNKILENRETKNAQINKQLFDDQYRQTHNSKGSTNNFFYRLNRNHSTSSNSSQKSYYGIVAQYRRKRQQKSKQNSIKKVNSRGIKPEFQNQIDNFRNQSYQKLLNRTKSLELSIIKPEIKLTKLVRKEQTNENKFGFRPRIITSASSKSSLKSSQSNLSNSSKNKIEQKVSMIKNLLQQRKSSESFLKNNTLKKSQIQQQYHIKSKKKSIQEKQVPQKNSKNIETLDYKELYQESLRKLKLASKQLQVQKKKNEITRQIYKSQIEKLKKQKSFQNNFENPTKSSQQIRSNHRGQQDLEKVTTSFGEICDFKIKNQDSITELKNKLKNSHLFTYQAFQSVVKTKVLSPLKQQASKQDFTNSILIVNDNQYDEQDHSQDMIVELSEELRESALHSTSLWRSKLSQKPKFYEILKSSRQKSQYSNESFIHSNLINKQRHKPEEEVRQITFNEPDNFISLPKNNEELKSQSLLLDLSSNLNYTKSFHGKIDEKTDRKKSQDSIMLDSFSLEDKELKISHLLQSKKGDKQKFLQNL